MSLSTPGTGSPPRAGPPHGGDGPACRPPLPTVLVWGGVRGCVNESRIKAQASARRTQQGITTMLVAAFHTAARLLRRKDLEMTDRGLHLRLCLAFCCGCSLCLQGSGVALMVPCLPSARFLTMVFLQRLT